MGSKSVRAVEVEGWIWGGLWWRLAVVVVVVVRFGGCW